MDVTRCCGAWPTYYGSELVCRMCHEEVDALDGLVDLDKLIEQIEGELARQGEVGFDLAERLDALRAMKSA